MFLFKVQCHKIFRISKKIMGEQKTRMKSYSYSPPFVHNFFELHESLRLQNCLSKIQKISQKTNRIRFDPFWFSASLCFKKSKSMTKNSKFFWKNCKKFPKYFQKISKKFWNFSENFNYQLHKKCDNWKNALICILPSPCRFLGQIAFVVFSKNSISFSKKQWKNFSILGIHRIFFFQLFCKIRTICKTDNWLANS